MEVTSVCLSAIQTKRETTSANIVGRAALATQLNGWKQFCLEFKVNSEMLMKDLPGFTTARRTEEAARIIACTPDEATAWMQKRGGETAKAPTVEDVAASLWDFVDSRAKWWG
jgi:hypothetical protein